MMDLPHFVNEHLYAELLRDKKPAYLLVNPQGRLRDAGGEVAYYGFSDLETGCAVEDCADFLVGMLPLNGETLTLPFVALANGVYVDVHGFPAGPDDCVLLLDASDEARHRFRIQQNTNELVLLREEQQKMLEQIRGSHDDLLTVLNQLRLTTAIIDAEGKLDFLSQTGRRLLSDIAPDPVGLSWDEVFPFDASGRDRVRNQISRPADKRTRVQVHARTPGRQYWMEIDVRDDPQDPTKRILYIYDISEVYDLRQMLHEKARFQNMVGKSEEMEQVFQLIRDVASLDATVVIQGETGTGKELVARAIHQVSHRKDKPFVVVNCAGLSDSLINSELFGHRKGAFTDAVRDQEGLFEAANGGTILLDEIGDIPMNTQTRILRVLEEREIVRIGETTPRKIDIRILAATNKDLTEEVRKGNFRLDLLYRIRVARITMPPLRKRREDIPLLAEFFLAKSRASTGKAIEAVSDAAMRIMLDYYWPGNVRELRNAIEYAVIRCRGHVLLPEDLPPEPLESESHSPKRELSIEDEKRRILDALKQSNGRRGKAAEILGISRATLYRRMKACFPGSMPFE